MIHLVPLLLHFWLGWSGDETIHDARVAGAAAVAQSGTPEQSSSDAVAFHCEVWSVSSPELATSIERRSEQDPGDAESCRQSLIEGGAGARRLARVLAPIAPNTEMTFRTNQDVPFSSLRPGQVSSQAGFGGTVSAGSLFAVRCVIQGDSSIHSSLSVEITAFEEVESDERPVVPPKRQISLSCQTLAPSGVLRMFQSQNDEPGVVLIFVRTTRL